MCTVNDISQEILIITNICVCKILFREALNYQEIGFVSGEVVNYIKPSMLEESEFSYSVRIFIFLSHQSLISSIFKQYVLKILNYDLVHLGHCTQ